jgi:ribosome-binding factor A
MKSIRAMRVEQALKESIGEIIQNEIKQQDTEIITVTRVECANDLRFARVFISIMGEEKEKSFTLLNQSLLFIRKRMGQMVRLKFVPEIVFILDRSIDHAIKIDQILEKIKHDTPSAK